MNAQYDTVPNPNYQERAVFPPSTYNDGSRQPADGRAAARKSKKESFEDAVRNALGTGVTVKESMSADIDIRHSHPHATTSLPYALGGRATHVQVEVASWLAGFQDPIKVCSARHKPCIACY